MRISSGLAIMQAWGTNQSILYSRMVALGGQLTQKEALRNYFHKQSKGFSKYSKSTVRIVESAWWRPAKTRYINS